MVNSVTQVVRPYNSLMREYFWILQPNFQNLREIEKGKRKNRIDDQWDFLICEQKRIFLWRDVNPSE